MKTKQEIIQKHLQKAESENVVNVFFAYPKAMDEYAQQEAIGFAEWAANKRYTKRTSTHPKYVGMWYSDIEATGYLTIEALFQLYLDNKQK